MMVRERALVFECDGDSLVGVLAQPEKPAAIGVLIVVGGPQYRAGSHRQFVHLARALAQAGVSTLRFDCRGMGDSEGEARSFEVLDDDIEAAVAALKREVPELHHVGLAGLCDGASAALMFLARRAPQARQAGVRALCLMNPWVRTETGAAAVRVRHYYVERLLSGEFWRKLFSGGVARGALAEAARSVGQMLGGGRTAAAGPQETVHFTELMARAVQAFDGPLLLVTSGRDYTAKEFLAAAAADERWRAALARPLTQHLQLPQADHTFSALRDQQEVERCAAQWAGSLAADPARSEQAA